MNKVSACIYLGGRESVLWDVLLPGIDLIFARRLANGELTIIYFGTVECM